MSCVFTALASGVAGASTLCVASPAGCLGTAFTAAQLQAALTTAAGDTDADTVMVGPGTFTGEFTMSSAGSVDEIVGSGVGVTTLTSASDNATTLTLQGGTVSALTLAHTAAPTAGYALKLSAGTARGIDARLEGSTVGSAVQLGTSGWVTGSTVRSNASGASGVTWTGGGNLVSDTQVVGTNTGYRAFGSAAADVTITIRRVRISGFTYGILVPDGTVNISDSLIDLGAIPTAIGIYQYNNAATASVIGLVAKRTTINGSGPAQEGIWGQAGNNTQVYTGTIADTVIRLVGASPAAILCTQSGGGVATMNVSHTAFKGPLSATGTCAPVVTGRIDTAGVDPLFRDAAAGDFRLQFTSPLIDVGTSVPAASDRDVSGSARSVDGNNAGGAQPDIGAFEYQRLAPTVVVDAAATALVGTSVAYLATAADPQAEGALTYAWTFDDGTGAATGTTASHSFATAGAHLATVTVTAVNGQTTAVTRSVAITSPVVVDPPKPPIVTPPSFIGRITSLVKATGVFPRTGTAFRRPVRGSHAKRLTIKLNAAGSVKVTLARVVKRHVTPLKGSVTFRLPKGASAVEFGGRWGKGVLPAGAYRVTATLVKSKPVSARAVTLLLR